MGTSCFRAIVSANAGPRRTCKVSCDCRGELTRTLWKINGFHPQVHWKLSVFILRISSSISVSARLSRTCRLWTLWIFFWRDAFSKKTRDCSPRRDTLFFILHWSVLRKSESVAMKSPLLPVTAKFFMDNSEYGTLNMAPHVSFCRPKCINDTSATGPHGL
jgi:hypothetical protein